MKKMQIIGIVVAIVVVAAIVIIAIRPADVVAPEQQEPIAQKPVEEEPVEQPEPDPLKDGEPEIMRGGSATSDKLGAWKFFTKFEEIVERETGGRIDVQIFHSGQLGGDGDVVAALQAGTAEFMFPATGAVARLVPGLFVFDIPFLFPFGEYEKVDSMLEKVSPYLMEQFPEHGLIGLGLGESGFRHMTNNARTIERVADLRGLKMRTMENPIHMAMFEKLGAMPAPLPFPELFSALQTGVFDGQENPPAQIYTSRFHEVQRYLTLTGHVYQPGIALLSKIFYDNSNPEERQLFRRAGKEALAYAKEYFRAQHQDKLDEIAAAGVTITHLTPEARQEFVDATAPVIEQFRDKIGSEILDKVLEAAGR